MPPPFCMLALQQNRGGAHALDYVFPRDDYYRLTFAMWACDVCTSTGRLTVKDDKVSLNMTQVVSVLTIAAVFTGLSTQIARFHH